MTSHASTAKLQIVPGSWQETFHEIYIGFVVGVMHNWYFIDKFGRERVAMPLATLLGHGEMFNAIHGPEKEKTLKVVGVGYGRTGTVCTGIALLLPSPRCPEKQIFEVSLPFLAWRAIGTYKITLKDGFLLRQPAPPPVLPSLIRCCITDRFSSFCISFCSIH